MRAQRRRRSTRRNHPNVEAWLTGETALPMPDEKPILLLDHKISWPELWRIHNPEKPYEDPIHFLNRLDKRKERTLCQQRQGEQQ